MFASAKESNKSRLHSYSVRNSVLVTSHIAIRDCRVYIFSDNFSRNSCVRTLKVQTSSYTLKRCPCYEPRVTHFAKTLPHITLSLVSLDL